MSEESDCAKLKEIIARNYSEHVLDSIVALTPDASTRTYYRITLQGRTPATIVAMCFESLASPEYEGDSSLSADEAYVQLTEVFRQHSIAVPELLLDLRESGILLIEDVGDKLIAPLLLKSSTAAQIEAARSAYRNAVSVLLQLQEIPLSQAGIAGMRSFSESAYFNEMMEFRDYLLAPVCSNRDRLDEFTASCKRLANRLTSLPLVVAHRDFHGWNLLLAENSDIRVIDFQDALLAPKAYDLVGLINDRDIDAALGKEFYLELLAKFASEQSDVGRFYEDFALVALQRDLKVAGRFAKLGALGAKRYEDWIPGTLRRIGRTLQAALPQEIQEISVISDLLPRKFLEIDEGYQEGAWY